MIHLTVCGAMDVARYAVDQDAAYIISITAQEQSYTQFLPDNVRIEQHIVFQFADTSDPTDPEAPKRQHIEDLIRIGFDLFYPKANASAIVHCAAGVSRSPAAAFIFFCIHLGEQREKEAINRTIESSVSDLVMPNTLMIRYADELLQRQGRMLSELERMHERYLGI